MVKFSFRLISLLLGVLFPTADRHCLRGARTRPVPTARRHLAAFRSTVIFAHGCGTTAYGTHAAFLRPCDRNELERWERAEIRLRRRRRRDLWLATHGVDAGPCVIYGVEVS
ncbi:hypothetical protein ACFXKG_00155 [Streptomyces sp. NPDC059255]|uniref:hypothetical protein n=1 Tax=Streptomyces sp. NPDC059255 TaxID=3346793 RepID=UPI0036C96B5E